jgi:4-diphosphocytidyl-2-C-methyl-D-erythritol kinase
VLLHCPAKLNLALAVGGPLGPEAGARRGFHPICSWFVAVSLGDDLELARRPEHDGPESHYQITWAHDAPRPSPIDWPIEKDLAVRAHRLLEHHAGKPLPIDAHLRKRIPVGGGLGGGSSDAAGMIRGVNALFDLRLDEHTQHAIAMQLGSDVAFFLDAAETNPRPAIVSGLGEELRRVDRVPAWVVLIAPAFGCPTGNVYRTFDSALPPRFKQDEIYALVESSLTRGRIDPLALFNDLARPAEAVAPELAPLRQRCSARTGKPVHITGSGSTMFILEASEPAAQAAARALATEPVATVISTLC